MCNARKWLDYWWKDHCQHELAIELGVGKRIVASSTFNSAMRAARDMQDNELFFAHRLLILHFLMCVLLKITLVCWGPEGKRLMPA